MSKAMKYRISKEKRQNVSILMMTVLVVLILIVFITYSIKSVDQTVTQSCFDNLTNAADELTNDLREASIEDQAVLSAMAYLIAGEENPTEEYLCRILNCYDISTSYLSYVELLRPDNTILDAKGESRDVSGKLDFQEEARKGKSVSHLENSTLNPDEKVIRNTIPVVKNDEVIFVLYGTITFSDLAQKYHTNIYNGDAYVFLVDGDTGDFILDTWHKSLGNITDFTNRKTLSGYTWEQIQADLKDGRSGKLAFVSTVTKNIMYLYYQPSGINNFSVMVMTPQEVALAESQTIRTQLYLMAGVIAIVLLIYMSSITLQLFMAYRQVKQLGIQDQSTGLLNRNAYDKFVFEHQTQVFSRITCIYIDVNGLHEINNQYGHAAGDRLLFTVANALKNNFEGCHIYRVGGDEFVVLGETEQQEIYQQKMDKAEKQIQAHKYSIAYGIVSYEDEMGVDRIIKSADELMLKHKSQYYVNHERRKRE